MKDNNLIKDKSMEFAVRVVNLSRYLSEEKREYILSKQIMRSGTSIGANIREGIYAQSPKDFVSKMSIALKEAAETEYWLELMQRTSLLSDDAYESIVFDCKELCKMLTVIVRNSKRQVNQQEDNC